MVRTGQHEYKKRHTKEIKLCVAKSEGSALRCIDDSLNRAKFREMVSTTNSPKRAQVKGRLSINAVLRKPRCNIAFPRHIDIAETICELRRCKTGWGGANVVQGDAATCFDRT